MNFTMPQESRIGAQYAVDSLPNDMDELVGPEAVDDSKAEDATTNDNAAADDTTATETNDANESEATDPLIEEAVSYYGFSREDAELLGDRLPTILAKFDEHALATFKKPAEESPPLGTQQQAPTQKAPTTDAEKQFELLKVNKIEDLGLSPDDFDEKMVGAFDVFKERLNSVVDALAQRDDLLREIAVELVNTRDGVKNIAGGAEAQAEAQFNEEMDKFYAGLGDEFQDVFGKVPLTRLTEASPLLGARRDHVAKMVELQDLDRAKGRALRTNEHYAAAALRLMHQNKLESAAVRKVEQQVKARGKAGIASPSNRTRQLSGREKALATIASHSFLTRN